MDALYGWIDSISALYSIQVSLAPASWLALIRRLRPVTFVPGISTGLCSSQVQRLGRYLSERWDLCLLVAHLRIPYTPPRTSRWQPHTYPLISANRPSKHDERRLRNGRHYHGDDSHLEPL
jgi:hypothetical protein